MTIRPASAELRSFLRDLARPFGLAAAMRFARRRPISLTLFGGLVALAMYGQARYLTPNPDACVTALNPAGIDLKTFDGFPRPCIDPEEDLMPMVRAVPGNYSHSPDTEYSLWSFKRNKAIIRLKFTVEPLCFEPRNVFLYNALKKEIYCQYPLHDWLWAERTPLGRYARLIKEIQYSLAPWRDLIHTRIYVFDEDGNHKRHIDLKNWIGAWDISGDGARLLGIEDLPILNGGRLLTSGVIAWHDLDSGVTTKTELTASNAFYSKEAIWAWGRRSANGSDEDRYIYATAPAPEPLVIQQSTDRGFNVDNFRAGARLVELSDLRTYPQRRLVWDLDERRVTHEISMKFENLDVYGSPLDFERKLAAGSYQNRLVIFYLGENPRWLDFPSAAKGFHSVVFVNSRTVAFLTYKSMILYDTDELLRDVLENGQPVEVVKNEKGS